MLRDYGGHLIDIIRFEAQSTDRRERLVVRADRGQRGQAGEEDRRANHDEGLSGDTAVEHARQEWRPMIGARLGPRRQGVTREHCEGAAAGLDVARMVSHR